MEENNEIFVREKWVQSKTIFLLFSEAIFFMATLRGFFGVFILVSLRRGQLSFFIWPPKMGSSLSFPPYPPLLL